MNEDWHTVGLDGEPPFESDWGSWSGPRRDTAERIAVTFRVPYWVSYDAPRPSWFRRPVWRARALYWRWLLR